MKIQSLFLILSILFTQVRLFSQTITERNYFDVKEAKQAVAVDSSYFYVINNHSILKYTKDSGRLAGEFIDGDNVLKHLNSGIIIDGKLYCAHSNYPDCPMVGSIEIFDPTTMEHIGSHSLGIHAGSATWIDYYDNSWWIAYAHYTGKGGCEDKDNRWTRLERYNNNWSRIAGWVFPQEMIGKFDGRSNSGGVWGNDGTLYTTGHDARELYCLKIPTKGFTLELKKTIPFQAEGQGIAIDKSIKNARVIYGIRRSQNQVVVMELH
jgi:outer membrane protein assembly factor BamB